MKEIVVALYYWYKSMEHLLEDLNIPLQDIMSPEEQSLYMSTQKNITEFEKCLKRFGLLS
jgi:hypothetical protein